MISSAIWCKYARVNFFKDDKIVRDRRASAICANFTSAYHTKLLKNSFYRFLIMYMKEHRRKSRPTKF